MQNDVAVVSVKKGDYRIFFFLVHEQRKWHKYNEKFQFK